MAKLAEEIEKMIHVDFHSSMNNVPQEARHTILLYHQVFGQISLIAFESCPF